jgi:hypothetical protein
MKLTDQELRKLRDAYDVKKKNEPVAWSRSFP